MNSTRRTKKRKQQRKVRQTNQLSTRYGFGPASRGPIVSTKYFDTYFTPTSSTTTVGYSQLTTIPQGSAQSQRVADTLWITKIEMRLTVVASTADVTNQLRLTLFSWVPNTASLTPGTTSLYENPTTWGCQSPFNYEGRRDYKVYWDKVFNLVGTSTVPTDNYQKVYNYEMKLKHRVDFNLGATTGYNHLYLANYSDSAVSPHPAYTYLFRVWYIDT